MYPHPCAGMRRGSQEHARVRTRWSESMKRVLFVDDDKEEFEFLSRGIWKERGQFEMEYATSGSDALERLALAEFDVVISSTRTVGMDGGALLQAVCDQHPSVVRILLASQQEMERALRAVP